MIPAVHGRFERLCNVEAVTQKVHFNKQMSKELVAVSAFMDAALGLWVQSPTEKI